MTNEEVFYDIKSVPLSDRESFNNTILLLTMVKSKYYYIIGFSRPDEIITIGFDFESKTEGVITRGLTIDFKKSSDEIVLFCEIMKTEAVCDDIILMVKDKCEHIFCRNGQIVFEMRIQKDSMFPSSVKMMNKALMTARREIETLMYLH